MTGNHSARAAFLHRNAIFYPICGGLVASAVLLRWAVLPFMSHDMQFFLLIWYDYIVAHGRFAALSDKFYNYTPLYIYMMTVVSYLDGMADRIALVKSISILFDGIAAFLVYKIALTARPDRRLAIFFALLFLNLPTLILNGAVWGQSDIIYTTFMLALAYFVIHKYPYRAMLMYGIAFAVKLQAIFLAPFVLYLIVMGEIPVIGVAAIPLVYMILIAPAALAGRGWVDLIRIYSEQADAMIILSAHAPNLYLLIQDGLSQAQASIVTLVAVVLAAAVSLGILVMTFLKRPALSPLYIILASTLWLGLEPSLLPRMHDRYFFPADMMAFVFACLVPRAWWIAVLLQAGSALAYSQFLGSSLRNPINMTGWDHIGAMAMIAAVTGVSWFYFRSIKAPQIALQR